MAIKSGTHICSCIGKALIFCMVLVISFSCKGQQNSASKAPIVVAYVESKGDSLPDPSLMSHIIYAFAGFNEARDGIVVQNPEKLKAIAGLKKINPDLKVILSIGGYHEEGYSDMAASEKNRKAFARNIRETCESFGLDGIDLDWEFPGTEAGGTKARPDDAGNYAEVARLLREQLGKDAWLSVYSNNSGKWIDFEAMLPYLSYVNVSGYNLGNPPKHQSNLYSSDICGQWSVDKSLRHHQRLGIPKEKILMGVPFFTRGKAPLKNTYFNDSQLDKISSGYRIRWDEEAKAPYKIGPTGEMIAAFDNQESLKSKCGYILDNGFGGVFYWNYDADYPDHRLARQIASELLNQEVEPLKR